MGRKHTYVFRISVHSNTNFTKDYLKTVEQKIVSIVFDHMGYNCLTESRSSKKRQSKLELGLSLSDKIDVSSKDTEIPRKLCWNKRYKDQMVELWSNERTPYHSVFVVSLSDRGKIIHKWDFITIEEALDKCYELVKL